MSAASPLAAAILLLSSQKDEAEPCKPKRLLTCPSCWLSDQEDSLHVLAANSNGVRLGLPSCRAMHLTPDFLKSYPSWCFIQPVTSLPIILLHMTAWRPIRTKVKEGPLCHKALEDVHWFYANFCRLGILEVLDLRGKWNMTIFVKEIH